MNFWPRDVGPVSRQLLTRAESFFDGLLSLTLADELAWSQVPKRGGSGWLDSLGHSLSGAWRVADYAAVSRVVRLSEYTWSGVWPSSA